MTDDLQTKLNEAMAALTAALEDERNAEELAPSSLILAFCRQRRIQSQRHVVVCVNALHDSHAVNAAL